MGRRGQARRRGAVVRCAPVLWAALSLGMAAGCPFSFTNKDHCAAQQGDATCASADPSRPYCALGCGAYDEVTNRTGCVAEVPVEPTCYSPCGNEEDATVNAVCDGGTDAGTDTGTSTTVDPTGSASTTQGEASTTDGGCNCDADAPVCVDGMCVACEDNALCAGIDDDFPYCVGGDCVVCQPIVSNEGFRFHDGCDSPGVPSCIDGTCGACVLPDMCPQTGCDFDLGLCGPTNLVFYIDPTGDDAGPGTAAEPLASIGEAIERIGAGDDFGDLHIGTLMVGAGTYTGAYTLERRTVILRPWHPEDEVRLVAPEPAKGEDPAPVFRILQTPNLGKGVLDLRGVVIENSPGPVFQLQTTGRLYVDDVEMVGNRNAIVSEGGVFFFRNSLVTGCTESAFVFTDEATEVTLMASTIIENPTLPLFDCSEKGHLVSVEGSIVGNFDTPSADQLGSGGCDVGERALHSLVGDIGSPGEYREESGYRLETNPSEMFEVPPTTEACEPENAGDPCPPLLDIDGKSRGTNNYAGFSVP